MTNPSFTALIGYIYLLFTSLSFILFHLSQSSSSIYLTLHIRLDLLHLNLATFHSSKQVYITSLTRFISFLLYIYIPRVKPSRSLDRGRERSRSTIISSLSSAGVSTHLLKGNEKDSSLWNGIKATFYRFTFICQGVNAIRGVNLSGFIVSWFIVMMPSLYTIIKITLFAFPAPSLFLQYPGTN